MRKILFFKAVKIVRVAHFKHDFLWDDWVESICFTAQIKAEKVRISKLSLLFSIAASKQEI